MYILTYKMEFKKISDKGEIRNIYIKIQIKQAQPKMRNKNNSTNFI